MNQKSHVRREPAQPPTRSVRIATQPSGIYARVVEVQPDGRETTIEWLGRQPSLSRIKAAAKQWGASLPGGMNVQQ